MTTTNAARVVLAALALAIVAVGCVPDPLTAYDVTLVTESDCTQTGVSAVQCLDEEEAQAISRRGRWVIEDKGGANLITPFSSFVLTNDRGRTISGVHFANNLSLAETGSCTGQGGECFFARVRIDTIDEESGCQAIWERSFDFFVLDGALSGVTVEVRLVGFAEQCTENEAGEQVCELVPVEACGTTTVSQVIENATGEALLEPVEARDQEIL